VTRTYRDYTIKPAAPGGDIRYEIFRPDGVDLDGACTLAEARERIDQEIDEEEACVEHRRQRAEAHRQRVAQRWADRQGLKRLLDMFRV
jgi:hypothetical protein